ncbi:hypothetical protein [Sporomusa acidovorans]|uniref:Uncharacterized protein n=1 Tax=Sporomusa acidovorans (strain ATCC 49682 / DSM 3132 / Mol) TaxID=1123286 RepID=A0ABZ3J2V2_SPOA4|nr:hypothetical protein [Sporomusa acidovorans]OZC24322.1 hypothetical protein SPACI_00090 [Sporomusa acidovorans DSM 3132]SDF76434.1 hypothetical protein SAMN04488499_10794 [Sporomusa acidovorans]
MGNLKFRYLEKGVGAKTGAPIGIALVDKKAIEMAAVSEEKALKSIASAIGGPVAINVFDLDAVTTTSDGVIVKGAIITMAAADGGKIHREFGILHMEEIEVDEALLAEEPHLRPLAHMYPNCRLFRGPDPAKKLIPVHNVCMTGKAINNNSATEMMNAVTMEEMLFPILGQLQVMNEGEIVFAVTGGVMSVGIGMTVAEKFGRVFPTRQFAAGETAHNCGAYAQTLKASIPCVVAPKDILAKHILDVLEQGIIPGKHLGCSPAVLCVAHAFGSDIAMKNIQDRAWLELESVGLSRQQFLNPSPHLTRDEILARADEIIPGLVEPRRVKSTDYFKQMEIEA